MAWHLFFSFLDKVTFGVGASGAIAGIMGVCIVRLYYKRMVIPLPILGFFSSIFPVGLKLRVNTLIIIGLDFAWDLHFWLGQLNGSDSGINHSAHLALASTPPLPHQIRHHPQIHLPNLPDETEDLKDIGVGANGNSPGS